MIEQTKVRGGLFFFSLLIDYFAREELKSSSLANWPICMTVPHIPLRYKFVIQSRAVSWPITEWAELVTLKAALLIGSGPVWAADFFLSPFNPDWSLKMHIKIKKSFQWNLLMDNINSSHTV